jgi:putative phosphoribosyl transferase
METLFLNRADAGRHLASLLTDLEGRKDALILALPRGGVPVAHELAKALSLPMDILLVRKLGVPGHEELAMGAIALGGVRVLNMDIIEVMDVPETVIDAVTAMEEAELERRNLLYRNDKPPPRVAGKTIILVDDGLATGATMQAGISALRKEGAFSIIVAAPVGAADTCRRLEQEADRVICAYKPEPFFGVGVWYRDFSQTEDEEVLTLLQAVQGTKGIGRGL